MKKYIHIIYESDKVILTRIITEDIQDKTAIFSYSIPNLKDIINKLEPEQNICLWIHFNALGINSYGRRGIFTGLKMEEHLKSDPICKQLKIHFVTAFLKDEYIKQTDMNIFNFSEINDAVELGLNGKSILNRKIITLQKISDVNPIEEFPKINNVSYRFENLNDWRLVNLYNSISKKLLETCLGICFVETNADNFVLNIIEPGLSGAYLFKVKYTDPVEHVRILKIKKIESSESLLKKELQSTKLLENHIEVSKDRFITFNQNSSRTINGFDCCIYESVENATTLNNFLLTNLSSLSEQESSRIIDTIIFYYENKNESVKNNWYIAPVKCNPWIGLGEYKGLSLSDDYKDIIKTNIIKTLDSYSIDYLKETGLLVEPSEKEIIIKKLSKFIDSAEWEGDLICGGKDMTVPIGFAHGDFNMGNILVNETNGLNPKFIDLSQVSNHKHAMLDFGKLSVEMEKRIIQDYQLLENKIEVGLWISCHNKWLHDIKYDNRMGNDTLNKIYFINTCIRNHSIKGWQNFNVTLNEGSALKQFYMIRIHYFLRMLGQGYIIPPKKLFAIKAVIDTLSYLVKS